MIVGGLERVGLAVEARVQVVEWCEVGLGEGALAEGSCEVKQDGLGGAGLLVEAPGADADGAAQRGDGLGERDQGVSALVQGAWWGVRWDGRLLDAEGRLEVRGAGDVQGEAVEVGLEVREVKHQRARIGVGALEGRECQRLGVCAGAFGDGEEVVEAVAGLEELGVEIEAHGLRVG